MARAWLTFVVGYDSETERRETVWPIMIGRRGLILWMNYAYPTDERGWKRPIPIWWEMLRAMK